MTGVRGPGSGVPYRVLLVDDDPVVLAVTGDALRGAGFEVLTAADWTTMTEVLFTDAPEVVILDVHLPGVQGDAIARNLSDSVASPPRVVLYSSDRLDTLQEMTRRIGAFGAVTKSGSPVELIEATRNAGASYRRERGLSRPESLPQPPAEPAAAPEPRRRARRLPSDPPDPAGGLGRVTLPPLGSRVRGRSVLIATETRQRLDVATAALVSGGLVVRAATSWEAFLEELKQERAAAALLDASLAGISGIQLRRVTEGLREAAPRILLWTRRNATEMAGLAREVRAVAVVRHELGGESLLRILTSTLGSPLGASPD